MRSALFCLRGLMPALAGIGIALCVLPLGGVPGRAAAAPLSISIVGNHFVDGSGRTIRLLGVNHTSSEYGCVDGFGYDDGHFDDSDAAAIASWGANAVRIPLNEDCWLGINGQPNSNEGANPPLTSQGYQREIESYVADLNAHGIYAILDLHWTAPGTQVALEQQPMPDQDHSPAFWTSVASTFKGNPAVVFDLFNEPYDPTDPKSGDDQSPSDKVSWNCWEAGTQNGPAGGTPCSTAAYDENNVKTTTYQVAGLQTLLNAVRNAGATQPVLAGGLDFANDLGEDDHGQEWMDHAPNDPLDEEAASFHNYMGKSCDNANCWKNTIAPIAAHVPVVTGEFDEDNFDEAKCPNKAPSTFDADYMTWADSTGVSYLAWGWIVEPKDEQDSDGCSAFYLIDNYANHTPAQPNGVALHDHLHALASTSTPTSTTTSSKGSSTTTKTTAPARRHSSAGKPPVKLETFSASINSDGTTAAYTLRSAQNCTGTLTGQTVNSYGSPKRHKVSLGTVHFTLKAGKTKTIVLPLTTAARGLLAGKRSLAVQITIALGSVQNRRTITHRTSTLYRG
jgi:Cellulase (glycosyl hydrolase family 5)